MAFESTEDICANLVSRVHTSLESEFYARRWGDAKTFETIPLISRFDFIKTPLSKRRYKNEEGLVKIVRSTSGMFLSELSISDIEKEEYGVRSARPMVYLSDTYDAMEKSLWCYEHDMVPLIGEKNAAISIVAARKYHIDSLITDAPSLRTLSPFLESMNEKLRSISILGSAFTLSEILLYRRFAQRVRLVLALPETGAFAAAEMSESPVFTPLPECILEYRDGLVLTKLRMLTTPIIRYSVGILVKELKHEGTFCTAFALY